eukprot:CAMPEP_0196817722 /NCGR_PEP_ID=MMETSP1362-20130617/62408_1 /TAXON_ID=163516 /ORGANISM="Leptocylindrus danicus, Strain CCMP1856" /LENGTH=757 /DNA_ID=CAMNT_0042195541 /DNA_START=449 /DNA_END=2722 /DNA_ORIENTATION=-
MKVAERGSYNTINMSDENDAASATMTNQSRSTDSKASRMLENPFSRSGTGRVLNFIREKFEMILVMKRKNRTTPGIAAAHHNDGGGGDSYSNRLQRQSLDESSSYYNMVAAVAVDEPPKHPVVNGGSSLAGFLALLFATCVNYMLGPMRDAAALAVGVDHIPILTLISTALAIVSSVPIGWLFEAPDPKRRSIMLKRFKLGFMTRGETQGTSLALFYRFFAIFLAFYALGFKVLEVMDGTWGDDNDAIPRGYFYSFVRRARQYDKIGYSVFYLFIHLMKLHSISLIWGVASEAMEFEEITESREKKKRIAAAANAVARSQSRESELPRTESSSSSENGSSSWRRSLGTDARRNEQVSNQQISAPPRSGKGSSQRARLQKMAFVGFGGTIGGIAGSLIASTASTFHLSGILFLSALLLEVSANLSIELGKIMKGHWEEQQRINSTSDLQSLADADNACDSSMKRSSSYGSMKRIASGNSLHGQMKRAQSLSSLASAQPNANGKDAAPAQPPEDDNTFTARLLRGVVTILRSNLLMAVFTYNALFASTSVLLSFQRAELVSNRSTKLGKETNAASDTAFLAKINTLSGVSVFFLQASGLGAFIAHKCGQRGSLSLMPLARLCGVLLLAWWHISTDGQPPRLLHFLIIDEFTRVINFAVAKPVREGLWRGLSNEARYEAKPIVDTLANRWGGGSAAFLVSVIDHILRWIRNDGGSDEPNKIFGFPPVMLLCIIISAWWAMVSAHVGHIRAKIDLELKKHQ